MSPTISRPVPTPAARAAGVLVALAFAAPITLAQTTPSKPKPPHLVRILVEDCSGLTPPDHPLPPLYLATSIANWDPAGVRCFDTVQYQRHDPDSTFRGWVFELAYDAASRRDFQFKFTRGTWATVEVDANGADIPNRTLEGVDLDDPHGVRLAVEGFADQRGTRWPAAPATRASTVTGHLDVFTIATDHLTRRPTIRVWLPPGYDDPANADRHYPVMYMHDAQNLFDAATSFKGEEWGVDETLTSLIDEHKVPPLIVVGIDNGPDRAGDYNPPYTESDGHKNHADRYLAFITDDLMPLIDERYRTRTGPENTGIGGSSYAGNVTLYAMMARPGVFGRALVESPAAFIDDNAIIDHMRATDPDTWPARVFIGVGTTETPDPEVAAKFVRSTRALAAILRDDGLTDDRLRLDVEDGAVHSESAWAHRLPEAMQFLWGN